MSWPTATISEVCEVVSGATPKTSNADYWDGDVPWVTPKDLSGLGQKYLDDTPRKLTKEGFRSCSAKVLPAGSVLFSSRAPIGLVAINRLPVCTNQGFKSMVPRDGAITADYLYWWLKIHQDGLQQMGRGATFKEVSKKIVEGISIPLPPLAEQKRIAAILDAADELRAKRRESIGQLDTLLQSVFLDMFGDPVTNPKGWEVGRIGDLFCSVNYGTSKKAHETDGAYPVIRMGNITYSGGWDFGDLKYVDLDEKERRKHLVHKGQVLFNRTNSKDLVGKTAVYREEEPMAFAGYLVRGIVNDDADPEYIGAFMNTPQTKQLLQHMCRNIVGMANINAKEFQAIRVPKPPVGLQRAFGHIVESFEQQRARLQAHLDELDTLFASLQSRAFRGDL